MLRCARASASDGRRCGRTLGLLAAALALPVLALAEPRSLLYREVGVASAYDGGGLAVDRGAPLTWIGFEYFQKRDPGPPGRLAVDGLDLYAGLAYDPESLRLAPRVEEAWLRFADARADTEVRVGRLPLPFGLNPALDLRGDPLLPLLDLDLGGLREWGLAVESHARGFLYEAAATWQPTAGRRRPGRRPLFSARVGLPTFRAARYGLSVFHGTLSVPGDARVAAWRLAADGVVLHREPFTALRGEVSLGADGGRPVWGLMAGLSQILPAQPRWQVLVQARRWRPSGPGESPRFEAVAGVARSLPYLMTLRVLWRLRADEGAGLLVHVHYYAA